jgi:hypothetical protein
MLPVAKKDANMVPMKIFNWFTEELTNTGKASKPILLTPGWVGVNWGRIIIPCFLSSGTWIRNWNMPPGQYRWPHPNRFRRELEAQDNGGDSHHVQHNRRERGPQERAEGIEHAHGQRRQADEQKGGKHDPRERYAENVLVVLGLVRPAPRHHLDHVRREDDAEDGQDREDDQQTGKYRVRQMARALPGLLGERLGKNGYEGRGHRTLGQKLAKEVRDAVRHIEGIGGQARAEGPGHDHVPNVPHHPAGEGCETDYARRLCDLDFLRHAGPPQEIRGNKW